MLKYKKQCNQTPSFDLLPLGVGFYDWVEPSWKKTKKYSVDVCVERKEVYTCID